jgi:hypothetical protein
MLKQLKRLETGFGTGDAGGRRFLTPLQREAAACDPSRIRCRTSQPFLAV